MYTVNRPVALVTKTRRGPVIQNVERGENTKKLQEETESVPKPYFQPMNGKKPHSPKYQEAISPDQEEVIKFIYDSWTSISQEGEDEKEKKLKSKVVYYQGQPSTELKDFIPFDLESWWGKRLYYTITKSVP